MGICRIQSRILTLGVLRNINALGLREASEEKKNKRCNYFHINSLTIRVGHYCHGGQTSSGVASPSAMQSNIHALFARNGDNDPVFSKSDFGRMPRLLSVARKLCPPLTYFA
jgi:hypothetical protein